MVLLKMSQVNQDKFKKIYVNFSKNKNRHLDSLKTKGSIMIYKKCNRPQYNRNLIKRRSINFLITPKSSYSDKKVQGEFNRRTS